MAAPAKNDPDSSQVESDPRFPSGRWTGFWLQGAIPGRQYMSLHLTFANQTVTGTGSDSVGDFTIAGSYQLDGGRCRFIKSYIGSHNVEYDGANQDDGMWIWGTWRIGRTDHGGFHIWPYGEPDPTKKQSRTAAELPAEEQGERVLVEAIGEE